MYICIWVRMGLTKPCGKPRYITLGRVFSILVGTYLNFFHVSVWSKIVSIYSLGRVCTMKWKKEWQCLNRLNSLIKQYRMTRPFGGCNPEFGVNHVYPGVPRLWCMCSVYVWYYMFKWFMCAYHVKMCKKTMCAFI